VLPTAADPQPSGSRRFNVLGSIDTSTRELTTVCNDTAIDAMAVCELLPKVSARDAGLPLTRVLDDAPYQKWEPVRAVAAALKVERLYLPAYSPNLNLIERLWKSVKKECLSCWYYVDFGQFKAAIMECLKGVEGKPVRRLGRC
jgi:hypothetical protein